MMLALAGLGMGDMMPPVAAKRPHIIRDGHTPWNNNKDARVIKWRAKERAAKKARKINWK